MKKLLHDLLIIDYPDHFTIQIYSTTKKHQLHFLKKESFHLKKQIKRWLAPYSFHFLRHINLILQEYSLIDHLEQSLSVSQLLKWLNLNQPHNLAIEFMNNQANQHTWFWGLEDRHLQNKLKFFAACGLRVTSITFSISHWINYLTQGLPGSALFSIFPHCSLKIFYSDTKIFFINQKIHVAPMSLKTDLLSPEDQFLLTKYAINHLHLHTSFSLVEEKQMSLHYPAYQFHLQTPLSDYSTDH